MNITKIEQSKNTKKIFTEITAIRDLATLIVVAIHTLSSLSQFFLFVYTSAVPIFFFLSGLSLTLNYKDGLDLRQFYRKRFRYLLPAYLFWTFLLVFKSVFSENLPLLVHIVRYITTIFTGNIMTLYFIVAIFEFYLIFPFLLRILKKLKISATVVIFLLLVLIFFIIYLFSVNFNMVILKSKIIISQIEISSNLIEVNISKLFFLVFMMPFSLFGIIFGLNYNLIVDFLKKRSFIYFISSIYVFLCVFFYFYEIPYTDKILFDYNNYLNYVTLFITLISILFYLTIFIRYQIPLLNFIGIISAGIYLSHRVVMIVFSVFFDLAIGLDLENLFLGFPYYIIVLIGSIILVIVIKKLPKSEYIILI